MPNIVVIREVFKLSDHINQLSGHVWHEHEKTTGYQVIGACGVYSSHKTLKQALISQKELQDFYNKFNL